jgi:hypothetical protein
LHHIGDMCRLRPCSTVVHRTPPILFAHHRAESLRQRFRNRFRYQPVNVPAQ